VSPNRFALAKAKAFVKTVVEIDLAEMGEEEPVIQLVADLPYPFTYDGTSLTADWVLPDHAANFKTGSSVGVGVRVRVPHRWQGSGLFLGFSTPSLIVRFRHYLY
jgi:hypothetical protein